MINRIHSCACIIAFNKLVAKSNTMLGKLHILSLISTNSIVHEQLYKILYVVYRIQKSLLIIGKPNPINGSFSHICANSTGSIAGFSFAICNLTNAVIVFSSQLSIFMPDKLM